MLESLLDLIAKIIPIIQQYRNKSHVIFSHKFDVLIDPMYIELEMIVKDMRNLFYEAKNMLLNSNNLIGAAELIEKRRRDFLQARISLRGLVVGLLENEENCDIIKFYEDVQRLFYCTCRKDFMLNSEGISSDILVMYELFKYFETGELVKAKCLPAEVENIMEDKCVEINKNISRLELKIFIDAAIINIEKQWFLIAKRYGILKKAVLDNIK